MTKINVLPFKSENQELLSNVKFSSFVSGSEIFRKVSLLVTKHLCFSSNLVLHLHLNMKLNHSVHFSGGASYKTIYAF